MKKIIVLIFIIFLLPSVSEAATVTFLTSGTSFSTPSDWTTTNTIECIGSGGNGRLGGAVTGRHGGGGGAYAFIQNLAISGSITYAVASGGSQGDTYFNGAASSTASISCSGGENATNAVRGLGGLAADSTGTIKYSGGAGDFGLVCGGDTGEGGGGGGSAGPGGNTGADASGSTGGVGGGRTDGALNGKEWNYGSGAGSGSGGGGFGSGDGGLYGGGGGGGGAEDCFWDSSPGFGQQGIIVITYWPSLSSMVQIRGGKVEIRGGQVQIY